MDDIDKIWILIALCVLWEFLQLRSGYVNLAHPKYCDPDSWKKLPLKTRIRMSIEHHLS